MHTSLLMKPFRLQRAIYSDTSSFHLRIFGPSTFPRTPVLINLDLSCINRHLIVDKNSEHSEVEAVYIPFTKANNLPTIGVNEPFSYGNLPTITCHFSIRSIYYFDVFQSHSDIDEPSCID